MKKNLLLRLCLMMAVSIFIYSCRTDQFPEAEAYNNSSKFQLTSKRISLNEAKHKAQLVTELNKVEAKLKTISKANVNGRVIDYGNGVSIDTDDVIYTENGPNYHNYTFYIKRENAPADAPLENLVLTPMTNGLYKELLISYNLTAQEKQTIMNGGFVDTKGKTEVKEISMFGNSLISGKNQSCSFQTTTYYMSCASGEHMPGQDGCKLLGDERATTYNVTNYVCTGIGDGSNTGGGNAPTNPGNPGDNGGGGYYPGDGTSEPCNENGATTSPTDPNTNIGEGGCSGIPIPINVPVRGALKIDPSLDTKVKCLLQKMSGDTNVTDNNITLPSSQTNDNVFQKMLRKFNGVNAPKITFKGENLGSNHLGVTKSLDYGVSFEIVINNQINSNLFTEATLIHELVHALMLNDLYKVNMIQWNLNTGLPELAYNVQTTCENNDFNSNIP